MRNNPKFDDLTPEQSRMREMAIRAVNKNNSKIQDLEDLKSLNADAGLLSKVKKPFLNKEDEGFDKELNQNRDNLFDVNDSLRNDPYNTDEERSKYNSEYLDLLKKKLGLD